MKFLWIFCLVTLVGCAWVDNDECIYDTTGTCVAACPEGTVAYTTGCSRVTPEATCDNPNPAEESSETCDFSGCYCKAPTVRDTSTNQCVTLDKCPKKEA